MGCTMHSRVGIIAQILWVLISLVLCGVSIWQIFAIKNFQTPRFRKLDYADQRAKFRDGAVANGAVATYVPDVKTAGQIEWVLIFIVICMVPTGVLALVHLFRQFKKYPEKVASPTGCGGTIYNSIFYV